MNYVDHSYGSVGRTPALAAGSVWFDSHARKPPVYKPGTSSPPARLSRAALLGRVLHRTLCLLCKNEDKTIPANSCQVGVLPKCGAHAIGNHRAGSVLIPMLTVVTRRQHPLIVIVCLLHALELKYEEAERILHAIASQGSSDLELSDDEADNHSLVAADPTHLSHFSNSRYYTLAFCGQSMCIVWYN